MFTLRRYIYRAQGLGVCDMATSEAAKELLDGATEATAGLALAWRGGRERAELGEHVVLCPWVLAKAGEGVRRRGCGGEETERAGVGGRHGDLEKKKRKE
jgi:hypothetical protein